MKNPDIKEFFKRKNIENYLDENYHNLYLKLLKYPEDITWSEKLYWFYNNINDYPVCDVCGKRLPYKGIMTGYAITCSRQCKGLSKKVSDKTKQTNLKKYGVENPFASKDIQGKIKKTNIKKYGAEYASQSDQIKKKTKQTNLDRYGCTCTVHNPVIQEKVKQTNLKKYGVENPFASKDIQGKIKQTMLDKYGEDNPMHIDSIKEKIKQTNLDRYGVENVFLSDEFQNKAKQTMLDKYGEEKALRIKEFKDKAEQTMLDKYGVKYASKLKKFQDKAEQTMLDKYGVKHYAQTDEYKVKNYNTKKKNKSFSSSQIEKDFKKWLDDNGINYKYQYRSNIYPFVCDFYFPNKNLYLEIQGYWGHGGHPFNPNNEDDIKTLLKWERKNTKLYENCIETWTFRDPMKRQWAKEHNLNWVEVFSIKLEDVINTIKDLI